MFRLEPSRTFGYDDSSMIWTQCWSIPFVYKRLLYRRREGNWCCSIRTKRILSRRKVSNHWGSLYRGFDQQATTQSIEQAVVKGMNWRWRDGTGVSTTTWGSWKKTRSASVQVWKHRVNSRSRSWHQILVRQKQCLDG